MKTLMAFLILFFVSVPSEAFFGLLGRDQCAQPQTAYPTYTNDAQQSLNVQIHGLESQKQQMEARMAQISQESLRLQAGIRSYIYTPWSETMLAHVDNGLDCCAPTAVYSILNWQNTERRPAGQDLPTSDYEVTQSYPVDPEPEAPAYPAPAYTPPKTNSCQGYPIQYCANDWGKPYSAPRPGGGLCLQTGFAATPAWYQAACRNGGKIDPQVCSNPQIAKSPAQYQSCINMLDAYQKVAVEKRQLGAHIQEVNVGINNIRYSPTGVPNPSLASSSETKSGVLSGIGNFLGSVVQTLGPFMLNQYMSYQQQKNTNTYAPGSRMAKYGPPQRVTNVDGSTPGNFNRPYYKRPEPPPPYYGPKYGYPFSYAGNYGATLPGYQLGGFGCTPGAMNNGMSLIGTLLGGALGLNANASLQSNFGPNGGYVPHQAYLNAYGNQYAGIPSYTFPGYAPPYQPGGIYGTTPTYRPPYVSANGYQSVPNYYSNQNTGYRPPTSWPSYYPPYTQNQQRPLYAQQQQQPASNYGWQYASYYYAQAMNNQQMLAENDSRIRERQLQINYQLGQIQNINSSFSHYNNSPNAQYTSSGYQTPPYYNNSNSGLGGVLQSLLSGNSAQFNLNMQGY